MKVDRNKIEKICKHISEREVVASRAERESIKYKQIEYLEGKVGSMFYGIVSGVTNWGIYVELIENKCEGMIGNKGFNIDTKTYSATHKDGRVIRLGDEVMIQVSSVCLEKRQIDFKFLE